MSDSYHHAGIGMGHEGVGVVEEVGLEIELLGAG
jgi:hypothetical protein